MNFFTHIGFVYVALGLLCMTVDFLSPAVMFGFGAVAFFIGAIIGDK